MKQQLKLLTMSDIQAEKVRWLWQPYLPRGKITMIQGDPGDGKTTFVLALTALLTRGLPMPGGEAAAPPMNVIYQTAEDGLADTIRPRLDALGAECSRVLVIDEGERELTLDDHRLAQAIRQTGAGLAVLDPIQAYLGNNVDMHRANEVRPIFKRLGQLAEQTGCAIVLVGHMNKMQGAKSAYRGLGSIDFRAAARSVLLVGRPESPARLPSCPQGPRVCPCGGSVSALAAQDGNVPAEQARAHCSPFVGRLWGATDLQQGGDAPSGRKFPPSGGSQHRICLDMGPAHARQTQTWGAAPYPVSQEET